MGWKTGHIGAMHRIHHRNRVVRSGAGPLGMLLAHVNALRMCLLLFLQFGEAILPSNFLARKCCHAGSGFLMLLLEVNLLVRRALLLYLKQLIITLIN